jgi:hypothetical protein
MAATRREWETDAGRRGCGGGAEPQKLTNGRDQYTTALPLQTVPTFYLAIGKTDRERKRPTPNFCSSRPCFSAGTCVHSLLRGCYSEQDCHLALLHRSSGTSTIGAQSVAIVQHLFACLRSNAVCSPTGFWCTRCPTQGGRALAARIPTRWSRPVKCAARLRLRPRARGRAAPASSPASPV